jgi:hypothetical protein
MRGFLAFLFLGLVALGAGAIGYSIGLSQHVATAAATGAPVYAGGWHWGGGMFFLPFGLFLAPLFFIAFFGFLAFAFGPRRRRWGRYGGYGPMGFGPYGPGEDDPRGAWIADAHRRLHEEEARRTASGPATGTASAGTATSPSSGPTSSGPGTPPAGPAAG